MRISRYVRADHLADVFLVEIPYEEYMAADLNYFDAVHIRGFVEQGTMAGLLYALYYLGLRVDSVITPLTEGEDDASQG